MAVRSDPFIASVFVAIGYVLINVLSSKKQYIHNCGSTSYLRFTYSHVCTRARHESQNFSVLHTKLLFVGTRARSCVQTVYFFSYLFRYRTDYRASLSSPREESRDIICVHIIRAILRHHELWRRLGAWQEESWDKLQSLPVRKRTFRAQLRRSQDSYVISCTRTRSTRVFFSTRCPVFLFVDFFYIFA